MAVSAGEMTTDVAREPTLTEPVAGKSPTQIAFSRLRSDKVAVACVAILSLMVILALLAPLITKWMGIYWDLGDPRAPDPSKVLDFDGYPSIGPPFHAFTWSHPLGLAPSSGADNLAYLLYGLRTSLFVATMATVFTTIVGVVIGLIGGFSRGFMDRLLGFVTDFFFAFPFFLAMLAIYPVIVSIWGKNVDILGRIQLAALILVLILFSWMPLARLIRGQVLSLREREFIQAA